MTVPMAVGATTILSPDRPTPDSVAAILRRHPVTVFYAVPTFYAAFLASPAAPKGGDLKLRCCVSAGEALPPDVGRRWKESYGVDVLDGIGSTEMLHIFLSNYPGNVKYGTTGKPVPGYDIRLVDDDGNVVKAKGEMGELQVRGPTAALMYWNDRSRSRERCRSTSRPCSRLTNIRAGSSFAPSCPRPPPARSSASSCARSARAE